MAENKRIYYHYTDKKGVTGISESGVIRASTQENNPNDVAYGEGAYLTTLPPKTGRSAITENNYGTTSRSTKSRTGYAVKIEFAPGMEPDDRSNRRNVSVYPGDIVLDDPDVVTDWSVKKVYKK